jgi:hypothetical protein
LPKKVRLITTVYITSVPESGDGIVFLRQATLRLATKRKPDKRGPLESWVYRNRHLVSWGLTLVWDLAICILRKIRRGH